MRGVIGVDVHFLQIALVCFGVVVFFGGGEMGSNLANDFNVYKIDIKFIFYSENFVQFILEKYLHNFLYSL